MVTTVIQVASPGRKGHSVRLNVSFYLNIRKVLTNWAFAVRIESQKAGTT
jgi:hypothetical protein